MILPTFLHGHVTADGSFAAVSIHTPNLPYLHLSLTRLYNGEIEVAIDPRHDERITKLLGF